MSTRLPRAAAAGSRAPRSAPSLPDLPPDLRVGGARRGWRAAEPVEGGSWRVTDHDGTVWAARSSGSGPDRLQRLARLRHAHIQRVDVLGPEVAGRGTWVLVEHVPGTDLATLLRSRAGWTLGQVVTLLVPLAQALDELHRAGLVHGDVAPGNVVVTPDGRPVLVDVLDGAGEHERGTPGVVAPERAAGVVAPAGDVHALGATVRAALELCDGRVANPWLLGTDTGMPDGEDAHRTADGAARLARLLERATAPDPARRPTAAELVQEAWTCAAPEPVPDVPGTLLAAATLRRQVAEETVRAPVVDSSRRAPRHRAGRPGRPVLLAAAAAAVACGAVVVGGPTLAQGVGTWHARATQDRPTDAAGGATPVWSSPARPDPVLASLELTRSRALALAAGDASALARVSVPGSPVAESDNALLAHLADRRVVPGSVVVDVVEPARLLAGAPALGRATVALTLRVRGEVADGRPAEGLPAEGLPADALPADGGARPTPKVAPSRVELDVRWVDGGWRVSEVRDVP